MKLVEKTSPIKKKKGVKIKQSYLDKRVEMRKLKPQMGIEDDLTKDLSVMSIAGSSLSIELFNSELTDKQKIILSTKGSTFRAKFEKHKFFDTASLKQFSLQKLNTVQNIPELDELNKLCSLISFGNIETSNIYNKISNFIYKFDVQKPSVLELPRNLLNKSLNDLQEFEYTVHLLYIEALKKTITPMRVILWQRIIEELRPVLTGARVARKLLSEKDKEYVPQILGFENIIPDSIELGISDETSEQVTDWINKFCETIRNCSNDMSNTNITHHVDRSQLKLNHNVDIQSSTFNNIAGALKPVLPILVLVGIYICYEKKVISKQIAIVVLGVLGLAYYDVVRDSIMGLFTYLTNEIKPQAVDDLVDPIMSIFTMHNFVKNYSVGGIMSAFKSAKEYGRIKTGVHGLAHDILSILQSIVCWCCDFLEKDRWVFYQGKNPALCQFLEEVNEFIESRTAEPTINYEAGIILTDLERRSAEISKVLNDMGDRQKLSFAMQALQPWITKKRSGFWYGAGPRIEPMCVFFEGSSQVGKSSCMSAMMLDVTTRVIPEERLPRFIENRNSEIYAYNWNRDHQDGYVGQFNCLIDDIGCTADVAGNENNVYAALIKMINSAPYHMNMADLPNKADAFFKSNMVWCTTNRDRWSLNSLYYNEAFVRRIRIAMHVELKEGWKRPGDTDEIYGKYDHLEFYIIEYDTQGTNTYERKEKIGGYEQARNYIITQYWKNQKKGKSLLDTHDNIVSEALKTRNWRPQINLGATNLGNVFQRLALHSLLSMSALPIWYFFILKPRRHEKIAFMLAKKVENIFIGSWPNCSFDRYCGSLNKFLTWSDILRNKYNCDNCMMCNTGRLVPSCLDGITEEEFLEAYYKTAYAFCLRYKRDKASTLIIDMCGEYEISLEGPDSAQDENALDWLDHIENVLENYTERTNLPYPCMSNPEYVTWLTDFGKDALGVAMYIFAKRNFEKAKTACTMDVSFVERMKMRFGSMGFNVANLREKLLFASPWIGNFITLMTMYYGISYIAGNIVSQPSRYDYFDNILKNSELVGIEGVKYTLEKNLDYSITIPLCEGLKLLVRGENLNVKHGVRNDKFFSDLARETITSLILEEELGPNEVEVYNLKEAYIFPEDNKVKVEKLVFDDESVEQSILDKLGSECDIQSVSPVTKKSNRRIRPKFVLRPQSVSPVRTKVIQRAPYRAQGENAIPLNKLKPQEYVFDEANVDIMRKLVLRNQLLIFIPMSKVSKAEFAEYVKTKLKQRQSGVVTMLGGRVGIMNGHFYTAIRNKLEEGVINEHNPVILTRVNDPQMVPHWWVPKESDFAQYEGFGNGDCVGFKLPEEIFPLFSNIIERFVSNKDMRMGNDIPGTLWLPIRGPIIYSQECKFNASAYGATDYCDYNNGNCWVYALPTKAGDCGALLSIRDAKSGGSKIVGIHTAGHSNKEGVAFPVFKEDAFSIKKGFEDTHDSSLLEESDYIPQAEFNYQASYKIITDNNEPPFRSKIQKAPLHDICKAYAIPVSTRVIEVDGKLVNPVELALSKNIPAAVPLNISAIRLLSELYFKYLIEMDFNKDYERKVQSFEIAVTGKPLDKFWRGISRKTSAGYPYKNFVPKGFRGKQHLFGKDGDYDLETPFAIQLKGEVISEIENLKNNYRTTSYFVDTFKDECLPAEKVRTGKGRLFSAGNIKLLILNRMYYGDFRAWYLHNRIYNDSAIGINVYSLEWDSMFKHLSFGKRDATIPRWIAIDISKFDGSMSRVWMHGAYMIMLLFYSDKSTEGERKLLNEHTLNSLHVLGRTAYERHGTNSSGGANTVDINTIVGKLYFLYACLLIINNDEDGCLTMSTLDILHYVELIFKNVRTEGLGDDLIICVNDTSELYGKITESSLIKAYSQIGVTATSDSKDVNKNYEYRFMTEVTFLKRTPVWDDEMNRYIGVLDINSIMKSVQWKRDNDPTNHDYKLTLQKALEELSLHPPGLRDDYIEFIVTQGYRRLGFVPITRDVKTLKEFCLARDEIF
jgi:hypothetical protein